MDGPALPVEAVPVETNGLPEEIARHCLASVEMGADRRVPGPEPVLRS